MRGLFSHDTDFDNFIPFIRYVPNVNAMSVEHFSRFAGMVRSLSRAVCHGAEYFGPSDFDRAENSDGFRICHDRRLGIMILLLSHSPEMGSRNGSSLICTRGEKPVEPHRQRPPGKTFSFVISKSAYMCIFGYYKAGIIKIISSYNGLTNILGGLSNG